MGANIGSANWGRIHTFLEGADHEVHKVKGVDELTNAIPKGSIMDRATLINQVKDIHVILHDEVRLLTRLNVVNYSTLCTEEHAIALEANLPDT